MISRTVIKALTSSISSGSRSAVRPFSSKLPPSSEVKKPSGPCNPCKDIKKEEKKSPCAEEKKSPCDDQKPKNKPSQKLCSHHKDLVPNASELCKLKSFELKSDCASFHMKSSGSNK